MRAVSPAGFRVIMHDYGMKIMKMYSDERDGRVDGFVRRFARNGLNRSGHGVRGGDRWLSVPCAPWFHPIGRVRGLAFFDHEFLE
jgi:hypothetical protein